MEDPFHFDLWTGLFDSPVYSFYLLYVEGSRQVLCSVPARARDTNAVHRVGVTVGWARAGSVAGWINLHFNARPPDMV